MRTRILGGLAAAAMAAALTAGCSNATPTPPPTTDQSPAPASASAVFNQADVLFVQGMIPHHDQALAMSDLAPSRAASPEVKDLATRINAAQGPEIDQMNAMLAAWGQAPPGSMSMSGMAMEGMASDQQMGQLAATSGPAFDRMFLEMMVAHHRGAISQSQTELAQGYNPEAKRLAEQIIAGQQAEIIEMQALLARV